MIFVTVGTHEQPFNRLIQKIDELKKDGIINEDVIIQTGFSTYEPKYCQWSKLIPYQQMVKNVADARIVITHGGPASFIMPLQIGKTPIVVPRQHQFNEHVNDHQVEFARNVARRMRTIIPVEDIETLGDIITNYDQIVAGMRSSSGGVATAVERAFIKNGGIVCSCTFSFGKFEFDFAETEDEVCKFTGSKYVKSNPEGVYKKILEKLKLGRKVLFIGLPCQVSAVRHYTKNHQNLYTADLICHGTPSPQILDSFLFDYGIRLTEIQSIRFREKNNFKLEQNGKRFAVPITTDNYLMTFLNSTTYTENCYQCQYAKIERSGDITLGDSWGSELEKSIQDKGISLVLCQNEKGKELIDQADLTLVDVDLKKAIESNHQLYQPSQKPKQREVFFKELKKGYGFKKAVKRCYPKKYLKNIVKTVLYNMKFIGGGRTANVGMLVMSVSLLKSVRFERLDAGLLLTEGVPDEKDTTAVRFIGRLYVQHTSKNNVVLEKGYTAFNRCVNAFSVSIFALIALAIISIFLGL